LDLADKGKEGGLEMEGQLGEGREEEERRGEVGERRGGGGRERGNGSGPDQVRKDIDAPG